ncbi:hypothetical protein SLE2022_330330 [Rubroshorea leprosula]
MMSTEDLISYVMIFNKLKLEDDRLCKAIQVIAKDEEFDFEILELMRSVARGRLPKETLIQAYEEFRKRENLNVSKEWENPREQKVKNPERKNPPGFGGKLMRAVGGDDQAIGKSKKQENLNISKGCQKSHEQKVKNDKGKRPLEFGWDLMRAAPGDDQASRKSLKQEKLNISKGCQKFHEQEVKNTKGKHPVEFGGDLIMMRAVAGYKELPEESQSQATAKYPQGQEKLKISIGCKRRFYEHGSSSGLKDQKKVKKARYELPLEEFKNQVLPVEMMNKIRELGGYDQKLVATKTLLYSDINNGQNRFLIPRKHSNNVDFLTTDEKLRLALYRETKEEENDMLVLLVEPSLEEYHICLREWLNGTGSNYLLTSGCKWSTVVRRNDLRVNDVVQLWSFRRCSELCFALVIVDRGS